MELAPELQFKHFTVRELGLSSDVLVEIGDVPQDEVNVCADPDRHVFYAPHTEPKVVEALRRLALVRPGRVAHVRPGRGAGVLVARGTRPVSPVRPLPLWSRFLPA